MEGSMKGGEAKSCIRVRERGERNERSERGCCSFTSLVAVHSDEALITHAHVAELQPGNGQAVLRALVAKHVTTMTTMVTLVRGEKKKKKKRNFYLPL